MNRSMRAKADKAKKYARQQVLEREAIEACATVIFLKPQSVVWNMSHKPFSVTGRFSSTIHT